jgi:hypothetical protein
MYDITSCKHTRKIPRARFLPRLAPPLAAGVPQPAKIQCPTNVPSGDISGTSGDISVANGTWMKRQNFPQSRFLCPKTPFSIIHQLKRPHPPGGWWDSRGHRLFNPKNEVPMRQNEANGLTAKTRRTRSENQTQRRREAAALVFSPSPRLLVSPSNLSFAPSRQFLQSSPTIIVQPCPISK